MGSFPIATGVGAAAGAKVASDKTIVEHDPAASDNTEGKTDLWGDVRHRYVLIYHLSNTYAQGEIQAQYSEYRE